ncbi:MAG: dUTP diphosphatase [bacterium]|nr:dUTP diphosphatase [bacterium]
MKAIRIKRLRPEAKMPEYSHPGDAGLNIYSCEKKTLLPGERYAFAIGWAMQFEAGYVGLFRDRSGLAKNHGLTVLGGVVDSGYRGEYQVIILNTGSEAYTVEAGDKIAQLLLLPIETAILEESDSLDQSDRGQGGLGSTGR